MASKLRTTWRAAYMQRYGTVENNLHPPSRAVITEEWQRLSHKLGAIETIEQTTTGFARALAACGLATTDAELLAWERDSRNLAARAIDLVQTDVHQRTQARLDALAAARMAFWAQLEGVLLT